MPSGCRTGLTRQQALDACWPSLRDEPHVVGAAFEEYQQWNVRHGLVPRVLDTEEFVDPRFLDHAIAALREAR